MSRKQEMADNTSCCTNFFKGFTACLSNMFCVPNNGVAIVAQQHFEKPPPVILYGSMNNGGSDNISHEDGAGCRSFLSS